MTLWRFQVTPAMENNFFSIEIGWSKKKKTVFRRLLVRWGGGSTGNTRDELSTVRIWYQKRCSLNQRSDTELLLGIFFFKTLQIHFRVFLYSKVVLMYKYLCLQVSDWGWEVRFHMLRRGWLFSTDCMLDWTSVKRIDTTLFKKERIYPMHKDYRLPALMDLFFTSIKCLDKNSRIKGENTYRSWHYMDL